MNAIGWQIGAVLFGLAILIIAIYVARTLNATTKAIERVNRIIEFNERNISEIIDNVSHIIKDVKNILDIVEKIAGFFKIVKVFKK